jgi:hypothetical protein
VKNNVSCKNTATTNEAIKGDYHCWSSNDAPVDKRLQPYQKYLQRLLLKKITIHEAARKLQIKLERSSLGDGIAWGTAGNDIDRCCNYNK